MIGDEAIDTAATLATAATASRSAVLYSSVDPASVKLSDMRKTDSSYRIGVSPKMMVQVNGVVVESPFVEDGDLAPRILLRCPDKFIEWVEEVEDTVIAHVKDRKEELFGKSIPDHFIEAGFQSSVSSPHVFVARVSPALGVYDCSKAPAPPSRIKEGKKVALVLQLPCIDIGKKTFAARWTVVAVKLLPQNSYCFVDSPAEEADDQ